MKNLALPVAIVLSGLLVGACSGPAEESEELDTHLKILYWQAPSTLNPYLSGGTKEIEAASLVLEPLANFDEKAAMVPTLAEEIPTIENGGFSADLMTLTWKLRTDVVWSDGTPFTAEDVVFTWLYCTHEEMGCYRINSFSDVEEVVAVDSHTVRIKFSKIKAHPYGPFVGSLVPIIQKNQFEDCVGRRAQECNDQNFSPIGTGLPFQATESFAQMMSFNMWQTKTIERKENRSFNK